MERIAPFLGSHLPAITIIMKAIAFNAGITHAHDESIIPEKGIRLPFHKVDLVNIYRGFVFV